MRTMLQSLQNEWQSNSHLSHSCTELIDRVRQWWHEIGHHVLPHEMWTIHNRSRSLAVALNGNSCCGGRGGGGGLYVRARAGGGGR